MFKKNKMKNSLSVFLLTMMGLLVVSCSNDEGTTVSSASKIARFLNGEESISISESLTENIAIPVYLTAVSSRPIIVQYEVTGDLSAYKDLSTELGSITIPAGEKKGVILIRAVPNETVESSDNKITVELVKVDEEYILGQSLSKGYVTKEIIFLDDDCDIGHLDSFVGAYSVKEEHKPVDYEITIKKSTDGKSLVMNNFWGVRADNQLFLDNCDSKNPIAQIVDGEYLFTHSTYGKAYIYQLPEYNSTFDIEKGEITLYFKCCVSGGCFTGGFDSDNKTHHIVEMKKK